MAELKNCPFCEAPATGPWEASPDGDVCRISCQDCGASVFDTMLDRCVERWNRRWNSLLVYADELVDGLPVDRFTYVGPGR